MSILTMPTSNGLHDPLLATNGDHAAITASHADVIDSAFAQFYLCIHAFGEKRKVDGLESTFEGQVIGDELVDSGRAKLIPAVWASPIASAARRLRELVHAHCLSGDGKSRYLINVERAPGFFASFNELVAEHDAAADLLAANYTTIQAEIREKWRAKITDDLTYHQAIGKLLPPTAEAIREKYLVEHRLIVKGDGTDEHKARKLTAGPVREWFELAHKRALDHVAEQRRARYREPIDRLRQGLTSLGAQIRQGDRISADTFAAFENTLILFNICADIIAPDLVETVKGLSANLAAVKAEALAAMQARSGRRTFTSVVKEKQGSLSTMIDRVIADCEAATSAQAIADQLGRAPRALLLSTR